MLIRPHIHNSIRKGLAAKAGGLRPFHGCNALRQQQSRSDALSSETSTPLQERDNVRNILQLAQQVRSKPSTSSPASSAPEEEQKSAGAEKSNVDHQRSRWWSRSWADVVRAQSGQQGKLSPVIVASRSSVAEMSEGLRQKLQKPKHMIESVSSFSLFFRSQPEVLEQYISSWGGIRIGKILEDLDSLAGDASYRHVLGGRPTAADHETNPVFIVTASVDRLDLLEPLRADRDYHLNGMVIYVGKSSMEVLVTMEDVSDVKDGKSQVGKAVLTGRFTMATRNASTGKSQAIPPLQIESEEEKQLFALGEAHKHRKSLETQMSLEKVPPTSQEAQLVHHLWLSNEQQQTPSLQRQQKDSPATNDFVDCTDTQLSSVSYMHPQQRNVHFKIFGGYLMRSAYELAFMTAIIFANGKPVRFLSLDALSFHLPVSIGALLSLTSRVTYTSTSVEAVVDKTGAGAAEDATNVASIVVLAELLDSTTGERKKSNTFHFSFDLGPSIKRVMPQSYRDSIAFIEGKRRVDLGNELRSISRTT